jgi:hypothetical protein
MKQHMMNVVEIGRVVEHDVPMIVVREVGLSGVPGKSIHGMNVMDDSIGESYCRITLNCDHTLKVELLDKTGFLMVNNREYICRNRVSKDDVIYLGEKKIKIELDKFVSSVWGYDISHLEHVWEEYWKQVTAVRKRAELTRKLGPLPSLIGVAIAAGTGIGGAGLGVWRAVIPALLVLAVIIYQAFFRRDESMLEVKLEKLEDELSDVYVCPSCGRYLRERWYLLSKRDSCPHCRAKFRIGDQISL